MDSDKEEHQEQQTENQNLSNKIKQQKNNSCKNLEENNEMEKFGVLSENHPLLQKFQQSLYDHLIKVQNKLLDEINELDLTIKSKEKEKDDFGVRVYDLQQEIKHQNNILEDYSKQIKEINENRIAKENNNKILRKRYDDEVLLCKEAKNYHKGRLIELENLQLLEMNIQKWAKEMEDEVAQAQRIVSKDSKDQNLIAEEKRKTDMLLFNLNSEVCKGEQELNLITEQIKEQKNVIDVLNNSLMDANSDLEVLQREQKRLTQGWNEVIIAINKRDKILFQTKERLTNEIEKHKSIEGSTECRKQLITKEIDQNEKLESIKKRVLQDLKNIKKQYDSEMNTIAKLQVKLDKIEALTIQTESDLQLAQQEGNSLTVKFRPIQSKIHKQMQQKQKLEDEIFKFNENQITADNGSVYRMKILKDVQNERRHIEENITSIEKQLSAMIFELELFKGTILKMREENERLKKIQNEINIKLSRYNQEIKQTETEIQTKTKILDSERKKLEDAINAAGGKEISYVDMSIVQTEKRIQDINKEIQRAQELWLKQQKNLIEYSEKRSNQINEMQLIRKHILLMEQKSLKINGLLQEKLNSKQNICREIKTMMTKLDSSNNKLFKKKKSHEQDEEECHYKHLEFIEKLKNAEMSVLETEQEITNIKKEIEHLKQDVLDKHREALSWESKYKMTDELIHWRNEEKSNDSDINHMKMEIRRMHVRYNELKRAQDKLVRDLENCVMHREKIFMNAMYRQKIDFENMNKMINAKKDNNNIINFSSGSIIKSRSTIQHKINEYKSKMKQIQNEINLYEKNLETITKDYENILIEINNKKDECENEKFKDSLIKKEIEDNMLMKYKNLEIIIKKQHRAKRLRSIETSKLLPKLKNDTVLDNELQKQHEINDNLINIIKILLNDYPEKQFFLTRILHTLQED